MPATPKTKEEIEQELFELRYASAYLYVDYSHPGKVEENWNYTECDYNTALQYRQKWFPYTSQGDVLLKLSGSTGIFQTLKNHVHSIPEPKPETVYVVRESSVMSKLNLILSSC